jgi:hypothetical protein
MLNTDFEGAWVGERDRIENQTRFWFLVSGAGFWGSSMEGVGALRLAGADATRRAWMPGVGTRRADVPAARTEPQKRAPETRNKKRFQKRFQFVQGAAG